jgi:hypothetical protein
MTPIPIAVFLEQALRDFRSALVARKVYDQDHQNLDRACNGAKDFARFLLEGPAGLSPRPPRKA